MQQHTGAGGALAAGGGRRARGSQPTEGAGALPLPEAPPFPPPFPPLTSSQLLGTRRSAPLGRGRATGADRLPLQGEASEASVATHVGRPLGHPSWNPG